MTRPKSSTRPTNSKLPKARSADEFIEGIASILGADDADEFFGGFKNILKTVGNVARKVAPIAKMIPIPQAQLIGGAADMIGNVLADEGDEFDALDAMADYAEEEEDGFDALAPAVAGLAIRSALKHKAAQIPRAASRAVGESGVDSDETHCAQAWPEGRGRRACHRARGPQDRAAQRIAAQTSCRGSSSGSHG